MNEHRRRILDMLAEGKINADEAERLIAALEKSPSPELSATAGRGNPRYLRVVVDADEGVVGDAP